MAANRKELRACAASERAIRKSGNWPSWKRTDLTKGTMVGGWCHHVTRVYQNTLYVVLVRFVEGHERGPIHLAIRTPSNSEPPWRDLQRIKNELFGEDRVAIQICPQAWRLIDEADMYHLWVMPEGHEFGFGLHELDGDPHIPLRSRLRDALAKVGAA